MPTYISLINFTQKGAEAIKDGPKRLAAAKQRFRDAGAELKAFYLVTGQYDAVSIVEAPNDEVVAKLALGPRLSDLYGRRLVGRSQRTTTRGSLHLCKRTSSLKYKAPTSCRGFV